MWIYEVSAASVFSCFTAVVFNQGVVTPRGPWRCLNPTMDAVVKLNMPQLF